MLGKTLFAVVLGAAYVVAAGAEDTVGHKTTFFDFAKITINERARADGYLRVRLQPESGGAREATLDIHKRMSENDIAKGIAAALAPVVGPEYTVDRTAGEHVKLRKADKNAADFAVEITFNVPGFSIVLEN
ncbi:MAG TPA: hypothetical protein VHH11_13725 [Gammaproteobacteria bacterium]|nr:hypothetical protein [Gammaproteobacteria bacterium]